MGPLFTGVAVVLLFSIAWPIPIRSVNGFLCFGVVLGGFVAGAMQARANDNTLESSRGLKLGARVGLMTALIVILVDLFIENVDVGQASRAGVDYLDPIPKYIYATIYGIWDGLIDLVSREEGRDGLEWPGRIARYLILAMSTALFGAFGGGIAASTVDQPSVEDLPENRPETPSPRGWMRQSPAVFQVQGPQEAQIYRPPEQGRRHAAAAGMQAAPGYRPPSRAGQGNRPVQYPARQQGQPQIAAPAAALPASPYAVAPPKPAWEPDTIFTPQPYFDEAAQMQADRRPDAPLSVEPPAQTPRLSSGAETRVSSPDPNQGPAPAQGG